MFLEENTNKIEQLVSDLRSRLNKWDEKCDLLFEEIFYEFKPLVISLCNRYRFKGCDADDIEQEGRVALYDAILSYEEDRSVAFSTYYYKIYKNRLRDYVRYGATSKRGELVSDVSLTDYIIEEVPSSKILKSVLAMNEGKYPEDYMKVREIKRAYFKELTVFEQMLVELSYSGYEVDEIAYMLNSTENKIRSYFYRIRKKFRKIEQYRTYDW